MKIQIESHTLERAEERGVSAEEIEDVINTGLPTSAKSGRLCKAKIYPYRRKRLGKYYKQKRVEVIYTIEINEIVTVTVYAFYGEWKD